MVENNATAIFSVDTNYCYRSFNKGHAEIMKSKYRADIELGKNILDYININVDREKVKKDLEIPLKVEESTLSSSCSEKNDLSYPYLGKSYFDVRGADNKFIGIAVVEKETTEPKQDEELIKKQTQTETSPTGHQNAEETTVMSEQIYPTPVEEDNDGVKAIHDDKIQSADSKLEIALPERKYTEESPAKSEQIYHCEHTKLITSTHFNSMLKVMRDVNRFGIRETDRQCFIQRCCDIMVEARGYEKAWILLNDEYSNFISAASAKPKEKIPALLKELQWSNNYHCVKQVLEKQQQFIVYSDVKSQ